MKGLIMKTLRGEKGLSNMNPAVIDVANVIKLESSERLFMIFDRDKPYKLHITYYHPKEEFQFAPVVGSCFGFSFYTTVKLEHCISRRNIVYFSSLMLSAKKSITNSSICLFIFSIVLLNDDFDACVLFCVNEALNYHHPLEQPCYYCSLVSLLSA